ncbi:MAG: hypothetical protein V4738_07805 [Pseudomonadota bacterium]
MPQILVPGAGYICFSRQLDTRLLETMRGWVAGVLLLFLGASSAWAQTFGDWQVSGDRNFRVATTENNSGSILGYYCDHSQRDCDFFFMPDKLKCNEGTRYALLVNGGRESSARSAICRRLDWSPSHQFANTFDSTDAVRRQMLNADSTSLGIARGTGADSFGVSKFSMQGFRAAYDKVNREGRGSRSDGGGPRDYSR